MVTPQSTQRHSSNTPFFNFWHSGSLALRTERQRARMSKTKNGRLDQYCPERFGRLILPQSEKCGTGRVNGIGSERVKGCCHGVLSAAWACSTIFNPVGSCRRPFRPSTSLIDIIPTARPIFPTVNCRWPVVSSYCSNHMELSPSGCTIILVFTNLPSAPEYIFPANPSLIYYYSSVLAYTFIHLSGLWNGNLAITSHDKNSKLTLTVDSDNTATDLNSEIDRLSEQAKAQQNWPPSAGK